MENDIYEIIKLNDDIKNKIFSQIFKELQAINMYPLANQSNTSQTIQSNYNKDLFELVLNDGILNILNVKE